MWKFDSLCIDMRLGIPHSWPWVSSFFSRLRRRVEARDRDPLFVVSSLGLDSRDALIGSCLTVRPKNRTKEHFPKSPCSDGCKISRVFIFFLLKFTKACLRWEKRSSSPISKWNTWVREKSAFSQLEPPSSKDENLQESWVMSLILSLVKKRNQFLWRLSCNSGIHAPEPQLALFLFQMRILIDYFGPRQQTGKNE